LTTVEPLRGRGGELMAGQIVTVDLRRTIHDHICSSPLINPDTKALHF
jgi:hypothetical protein